jgi:CubicO group peptidase (beta-lactamase class C family)
VTARATELEACAASFVREHRLPGVAAGVVHGDDLAWSTGLGFADIAARRPPDPRTLYRIASITKTFTGTAVMQLRDEGRLHLDAPVTTYLPELRAASGPIEAVTIRRMLSHESGLMGDPPGTNWSDAVYQGDPMATLARAPEIAVTVPPNTQQKYSNLAYQLLGEVVTRVTGVPYAEYVRDAILSPLQMSSTAFEPPADRLATGYAARGFSDDLPLAIADPPSQAEGGLCSCVEDLARWLSFQFRRDADGGGAQVLAGRTLREMHRPRYLGNDEWTLAWGIAWYAIRRDDVVWVQHSGGLHGFATDVCFHPEDRVGAIALVNGSRSAELAMDLGTIARGAVRAAPRPIEVPMPLPEDARALLGLYADPEYHSVLRLEWRDGKLTFLDPEAPDRMTTLTPADGADAYVVDAGVREAGERCTFHRRGDGRVRSVALGPAVLRRLDPLDG